MKFSRGEVTLVSMPFGPIYAPSLALGLLKAVASSLGYNARIHYFNALFAEQTGAELYQFISAGVVPSHYLLGELVFAHCLNSAELSAEDYLSEVLLREFPAIRTKPDEYAHIRNTVFGLLFPLRSTAAQFIEACAKRIIDEQPSLVGFTSTFQQNVASLALARKLKESMPDCIVMIGGANCEGEMGAGLLDAYPFLDLIVSGEGEAAFAQILERHMSCRSFEDIPGVLTRERQVHSSTPLLPLKNFAPQTHNTLDHVPIPDFTDWFAVAPRLPVEQVLLFESSRGCWWGQKHHCIFCGLNGGTMQFRSKSPERVLSELKQLVERYGIRRVHATDNIIDFKYYENLLPILSREALGIELFYEVKANLTLNQLQELKNAGVTQIQPGIESLSDQVLRLMRKGVRAIHNVRLLKNCRLVGIKPSWGIIWGFPGEDSAEYEQMANDVSMLAHLDPPEFDNRVRLDRFSPLFNEAEHFGIENVRPSKAYEYAYPDLSTHQLSNLAYYFDFSYRDGRAPDKYSASLAREVGQWREYFSNSEMVSFKKSDRIIVLDTRQIDEHGITVLEDRLATLYELCEQGATIVQATHIFPEAEKADLLADLELLTNRKLLLEIEGTWLALALPLEAYCPKGSKLLALLALLRSVGIDGVKDSDLVIPLQGFVLNRVAVETGVRSHPALR